MLPGWVADVVRRRDRPRPACGSASTATTTPAARSPTRSPRSTPARPTCRARSTATASAPATPTWSRWSPTSSSSWTGRCCPTGLLREATRIAHAVAEVTNVPPASRQPYVGVIGVRAQGRPARQRDQGRPEPLPAHGPGRRRQRHAAAGLRHGRPRVDRAQGPRARLRPRRGDRGRWSTRVTDRVKEMESRGYTFEAADASFELLLVEEVEGARPSYFDGRVVAGDHRDPASQPGEEAVSEATVKLRRRRRADRRHRRGQRPGQRARPGAARGDRAGLPGGREVRADRLQGADPRPGPRHRRDHPGADRDHRRRGVLGHRRASATT